MIRGSPQILAIIGQVLLYFFPEWTRVRYYVDLSYRCAFSPAGRRSNFLQCLCTGKAAKAAKPPTVTVSLDRTCRSLGLHAGLLPVPGPVPAVLPGLRVPHSGRAALQHQVRQEPQAWPPAGAPSRSQPWDPHCSRTTRVPVATAAAPMSASVPCGCLHHACGCLHPCRPAARHAHRVHRW